MHPCSLRMIVSQFKLAQANKLMRVIAEAHILAHEQHNRIKIGQNETHTCLNFTQIELNEPAGLRS